jgi:hypothetical protein
MTEPDPKRLRWSPPESPPPARPYRDSAVLYGVLAAVIIVLAWLTGGGIGRAVGIAAVFFVAATAWSFWQWRGRLRRAERDEAARRERSDHPAP